eukprot:scaffold140621_cov19-Tisochrysis_lutea.AAC.1
MVPKRQNWPDGLHLLEQNFLNARDLLAGVENNYLWAPNEHLSTRPLQKCCVGEHSKGDGSTPLSIAKEKGHENVVQLLMAHTQPDGVTPNPQTDPDSNMSSS